MTMINYTFLDQLCLHIDRGLKTLSGAYEVTNRENPSAQLPEANLIDTERTHAASLMRVNHTGDICAQALYQGQAITAKNLDLQQQLMLLTIQLLILDLEQ